MAKVRYDAGPMTAYDVVGQELERAHALAAEAWRELFLAHGSTNDARSLIADVAAHLVAIQALLSNYEEPEDPDDEPEQPSGSS